MYTSVHFSSVAQSVSDSETPWTAAQQASLSITNSWSFLKFMSIESVMPSKHLILSSPYPPAFSLSHLHVSSETTFSSFRGKQVTNLCCSVAKSCTILCLQHSMDCSTPDLPVPYYLLEFAKVHVH